jgi:hypothetical protein
LHSQISETITSQRKGKEKIFPKKMRTERGEKGVKIRAYSYKEIKRKIWDLKDAEHLQTEPGVVSP